MANRSPSDNDAAGSKGLQESPFPCHNRWCGVCGQNSEVHRTWASRPDLGGFETQLCHFLTMCP